METITREEFVNNFHSLNGITIGERRKNLFLLLKRLKESNIADLDFTAIQPKTFLEEKFKVEVLLYFKKVPELVELLKCENPIVIHRILKTTWFMEEAFKNVTGEQLVTSIFPYVSFSTKVKIVNKLSVCLKNVQQADALYNAIEKKYGLYLASKLLPSCSSNMVINCIKSHNIKPTPRQVKAIIKRYPEITEDILKILKSRMNGKIDYKKYFVLFAEHDTPLFLKLYKEYNSSFELGWRLTDKLIRNNKQNVIVDPYTYYALFHKKQISKSLKGDFQGFYANLFPKTMEQLVNSYDLIFSIFKQLPIRLQDVNLLLTTFQKLYGCSLWDHTNFVTPELLKMVTPDEREKRLKIEYKPETMSEDEWNCLWKTKKSIPYLKKRISLSSSIKTRAELIELMVKTCKINEDKVALADVCKYILAQHRNDHITVRLSFIKTIKRNFKLEYLDDEHWTPINELIKIFTINDEPFYHNEVFLEGYIHFRLIHKLPVDEQLTKWINLHHSELNIIKGKPQYEKKCLLGFGEIISKVYTGDNEKMWHAKFLHALINWNKRHQDDNISLFDYNLMETLKQLLKETWYSPERTTILNYCLRTKTNIELKSDFLNLYLSNPHGYCDVEVMHWLGKYEPLVVLQNVEDVTQAFLKYYYRSNDCFFWKHCRNYSHLEIPSKIVNVCMNTLDKDRKTVEHKFAPRNAIVAVSCLMSADEFVKFIVAYYPSAARADVKGQKLHAVQKDIGISLKNILPPSRAFESISGFCKGDYLKLIRPSLYSVCDNVNEDKLLPFLDDLMKRSVSVRKHALHLTFRVLDKSQIWNVLNHFMKNDKNPTVRKFIFKCAFNFFVRNASDYSWKLVKTNANLIDANDKDALAMLMNFDKVPQQYFVKYIPFVWEFLNKLPDRDGSRDIDKACLLNSVTSEIIQFLPKKFCETIINNHLFKCEEFTYFQAAVQAFTCKYIIHCDNPVEQEERLQFIFALLKTYIVVKWRNSDLLFTSHSHTANYVKAFCSEFLDKKCSNKEVLDKFINLWNNIVQPHEYFSEYLYLQFTLLHVQNLPLPEIGQKLADLCDSLAQIYGSVVVDSFLSELNNFNQYFIGVGENMEERFILIESLVKSNNSIACMLLVILLLSTNIPVMQETKVIYNNIMEVLEKRSDPVIQLYLHRYFKGIANQ